MADQEPRVTSAPLKPPVDHPSVPRHEEPPAQPAPVARRWGRWRWLVIGGIALMVLAAGLYWGVPFFHTYFTTVSTDDAYVNGHVTNLSARVGDFVEEVRVDDNDFVQAGALLLRLDREPYQAAVAQKQAALEVTYSRSG